MFSSTYRLLERESLIVRSCLSIGLTELRCANLNEKGRYYTGFFQLAIGIERMAKLALILDHMAQHNLQPPGQRVVKGYGHDLQDLIATVVARAAACGYKLDSGFPTSQLSTSILQFLSEFAQGMRYANLDSLASGTSAREPMTLWSQLLEQAVDSKAAKQKQVVSARAAAIASRIADVTLTIASDLSGVPLTTKTALVRPQVLNLAAKHVIWEILTLLSPLRDVVVAAGEAAQQTAKGRSRSEAHVPYMSEFFDFIWLDRQDAMRKKRWP